MTPNADILLATTRLFNLLISNALDDADDPAQAQSALAWLNECDEGLSSIDTACEHLAFVAQVVPPNTNRDQPLPIFAASWKQLILSAAESPDDRLRFRDAIADMDSHLCSVAFGHEAPASSLNDQKDPNALERPQLNSDLKL